ncbi:unnamed protein product [Notodromas monacha]|uniref:Nudix hydrolase domain-containing protein n=1 Tax=Notodromas monacha TaxID=399045 RepID=A0A7R9BIN9_9CRUS|nr:unnamed protein product [Notodromas monacha]CAG0915422.1 unnamed protein product [Notodromas monacha]
MGEESDFWDRSAALSEIMIRGDASRLIRYARQWNAVCHTGMFKNWTPVIVCGQHSGFVTPEMKAVVKNFPELFSVNEHSVELNRKFSTCEERSLAVGKFIETLRKQRKPGDPFYKAFDYWRNEVYDVWGSKHDVPLLQMERSCMWVLQSALGCVGLLGFRHYAVFLNGFVRHPERGLCVWFQKRALSKTTWPGKWDVMAGGGTTSGQKVRESVMREACEEASIKLDWMDARIRFAGCVSFFHQDPRGIFPNVYHVFDVELDPDLSPEPGDGEASEFQLLDTAEALDLVCSGQFKMTSGPVVVDFLIRHGVINPDEEPYYAELVEHLHAPLHIPHGCFQSNGYE